MSAVNGIGVGGAVHGPVFQAGEIGDVHFHHPGDRVVVPKQLPGAFPHFVGRARELADLTAALGDTAADAKTLVISAISGTAGVGKTTLAVHWAHQVADRFPDGQLYVNLRGFDPVEPPMQPADAIRGFLDAFGVSTERIVSLNLDAQAALYRSLLAGRRVLVVLDNARSAEQVRPLLPGHPTCLAVVTSRDQLMSLVVREGARSMTLQVLSDAEATELLILRVGARRVRDEQIAAQELIDRCARLPLALALVTARAAMHPALSLARLAEELRDEQKRLDALDCGDFHTGTRAVFSWSYGTLGPSAGKLFRLIGLHPGVTVSSAAVAALAGVDTADVRAPLAELTRAHLLEEPSPGRYQFHDLLRSYAAGLAAEVEPETQRRAAVGRVLDFYLRTSAAADRLIAPQRGRVALEPAAPEVRPVEIACDRQALEWFVNEHQTLMAAIEHAVQHGFNAHAWQLAWTLATYFERHGHWYDWVATQQAAITAATRLADRAAKARAHRLFSRAAIRLGRHEEAATHLRDALDIYRELDRRLDQARTHIVFSWVRELQERYADAVDHARQALDLFSAAGHRAGQARALDQLGWEQALLGDFAEAHRNCQEALVLFTELDHRPGLGDTLDSLGYIYHHLGRHAEAFDHYERSIAVTRELGDRYTEATTWSRIGDTYLAVNDPANAERTWRTALGLLHGLAHPDAESVRDKLACLSDTLSATERPPG